MDIISFFIYKDIQILYTKSYIVYNLRLKRFCVMSRVVTLINMKIITT